MFLEVHDAELACPVCKEGVGQVAVCNVQVVNTRQAQDLRKAVGHLAALVGRRWMWYCASDARNPVLRTLEVRKDTRGVALLVEPLEPVNPAATAPVTGQGPKAAPRRR